MRLPTPRNATPAPGEGEKVAYLFIQSFQAGALTPKVGEEGRFTLTLESGLGQTIYFSDRPLRDVGATPTPQFLENLGFPADNPPNAALLVEDGGNVNMAVVELFNPSYDEADPHSDLRRGAPGGLRADSRRGLRRGAGRPERRARHLRGGPPLHRRLPDTAPSSARPSGGTAAAAIYGSQGFCWNYSTCVPCHPYGHANPYNGAAWDWWTQECNRSKSACKGECVATPFTPAF